MEGGDPCAIWPATGDDEVQTREVYSRYGLAMYMAHCLEHGIVNALVVLDFLPTRATFADEAAFDAAFDRFFEVEFAKTFGNLLRTLNKHDLPAELRADLDRAKRERDHLAHRFFREHDLDFATPAGRTRMIAACEERMELFKAADEALERHVEPDRERFGITAEWVETHMAKMADEALARDRDDDPAERE